MCMAQTYTLPFKETLLRDHRRTVASAFSRTSKQFFSDWRSQVNQTTGKTSGPSIQVKGLRLLSTYPSANAETCCYPFWLLLHLHSCCLLFRIHQFRSCFTRTPLRIQHKRYIWYSGTRECNSTWKHIRL